MPENQAAWTTKAKGRRLEIRSAPYTSPEKNQIVIKNGAIALNPVDWAFQEAGNLIMPWVATPFIIGSDVAGEVVEVGSEVSRFEVGDRVVGFAMGVDKDYNTSSMGTFQNYTVLIDANTSHIPSNISYEAASVLPLALSTAASGLFQEDFLNLQYPTTSPKPTGETLLIWGGSTSVGCCTIQLAVAAGYEVISTCSPPNFELLRKLGASQVFDYNSKTVAQDIVTAFKGKKSAGAYAIGHGSSEICVDIISQCEGKKFVAMASQPIPMDKIPTSLPSMIGAGLTMASFNVQMFFKTKMKGVQTNFIWGSTLTKNSVGPAIYVDYLGDALAKGTFVPAPEEHVFGHGLESIQPALDFLRKGVSAKKVVVTL